jgi:cell division protein FtsW (lipid II flippase)
MAKLFTLIYLVSLTSTLLMTCRHQLYLTERLVFNKVIMVLFVGYSSAITFVFAYTFHGSKPLLYLGMLTFYPFILLLVGILNKYGYEGELSILVIALMLNSISLLVLYRLDISSGWFLTRFLHYDGNVPIALKQMVHSMIALFIITLCIAKGMFQRIITDIENVRSFMVWGIGAFILLATPKILGLGAMMAQDTTFQPSEFAFKIVFLIFIAKFYESRASELVSKRYPLREVVKTVFYILVGITVFFFFPLVVLQKELGTALLIGLTFIILTTYVTGRVSFFFVGLALIALAMYIGVLFPGHVEKRLIGAWIEWREYAFKPFREGENLHPGYQLFTAIASYRMSPWGAGIGNGILNRVNGNQTVVTIVPKAVHDFVAVPIMAELGILCIAIIGISYLILIDKATKNKQSLSFRAILSVGITVALSTQGLYNLSCVTALLPITGIPLPWISYGGSAIFANYIMLGFLIVTVNDKGKTCHEK